MMKFSIQTFLENDRVALYPLREEDFEELYAVASDPRIWEQHPNKDRWRREVFENFFKGAMESGGAYKIVDKETGAVIGSTRIYDYDETTKAIFIGYTFFAVSCWGQGFNKSVKELMLDYLFQYVSTVYFHIGAVNIRSQKSIERIGAKKVGEEEVTYYGEAPKLNYVYEMVGLRPGCG